MGDFQGLGEENPEGNPGMVYLPDQLKMHHGKHPWS